MKSINQINANLIIPVLRFRFAEMIKNSSKEQSIALCLIFKRHSDILNHSIASKKDRDHVIWIYKQY